MAMVMCQTCSSQLFDTAQFAGVPPEYDPSVRTDLLSFLKTLPWQGVFIHCATFNLLFYDAMFNRSGAAACGRGDGSPEGGRH